MFGAGAGFMMLPYDTSVAESLNLRILASSGSDTFTAKMSKSSFPWRPFRFGPFFGDGPNVTFAVFGYGLTRNGSVSTFKSGNSEINRLRDFVTCLAFIFFPENVRFDNINVLGCQLAHLHKHWARISV